MCVPGCQETVVKRLSRRNFLKAAGAVAGLTAVSCAAPPLLVQPAQSRPVTFSRVVDLTHAMGPDFPTYFGAVQLEIEDLATLANDGFNMKRWTVVEHTGTHMDAPFHFSADQASADLIPIENLVVPLAVVDIRAKAAPNPDAQLTLDDLRAWEAQNGPIPAGACVAMLSGWEEHLASDKFRNADGDGVMHFPGFHIEAIEFLLEERAVHGIAVDTLSLDFGASPDFAVHYRWLPAGRWGMESVANLGQLPAKGATIVAGGPKIKGATGGPSRVIALV